MAEGSCEAARVQPRQRPDLHRGKRGVSQRHGHQAQPDPQTASGRQRAGGHHESTREKAVLDHPQFVEPQRFRAPGKRRERGHIGPRWKDDTDGSCEAIP